MREIFVDAGHWVAALNPRDPLHQKARQRSTILGNVRFVTSEMVLTEMVNHVSTQGALIRKAGVDAVDRIRLDPNVEVVPQSPVQFARAAMPYRQRLDKNWSLTDCASFQIMWDRGITEALAHDRHFEQAGFAALLRG